MKQISIFAVLVIFYLVIGVVIGTPDHNHLVLMGMMGCFQLLLSIMTWIKRGNSIVSPYIIFLLALYIFSYGQSLLYPFGIITERDLVGFQGIKLPEVFYAQIYTMILLAFFQIGALCVNSHRESTSYASYPIDFQNRRITYVGWILLAVSAIPYYQQLILNYTISMMYGYNAVYEQETKIGLDNVFGILSSLFVPSLICLFVAYRKNQSMRVLVEGIVLFSIVITLLTGGRSNAVILIALLLVMHNYLVKKFSKKALIILAVGGYLFLSVLSYISEVRTDSHRSLSSEDITITQNGAVSAIGEMGSSMFCLIKSQNIVPEREDYRYGKSYLYSFTTIIPNLGFWQVHPAKKEANLSVWLTQELGLSYGTGFSMCAEAYVNLGFWGGLMFFLWGYLFAKYFERIETSSDDSNSVYIVFLLIVFWFALKLPRNSFIGFIRPLFFYALPIYWLCRGYIYKSNRKIYD